MLTIVSGYWNISKSKYTLDDYRKWMTKTLRINCPYVFFGNKDTIEFVKKIRYDLPTYYIELEFEDFYCYKFRNNILDMIPHVPCKDINIIWNEKVFLIHRAKQINPFNSEYFMWIDAAIYLYRNIEPSKNIYPNHIKINNIPKNKFLFCSSDRPYFEKHKVHPNHYYHYISGNFMIHIDLIDNFSKIYKEYVDKYLSHINWINTDQKILTHIYNDYPELFYKISDGYGNVISYFE